MTRYIPTETEIAQVVDDTGMTAMQARRHLVQRKLLADKYSEAQRWRVDAACAAWRETDDNRRAVTK